MADSAYQAALTLLARRELSEAQLRQRLSRQGHTRASIDEAVSQLREERSLDDARVAATIARREMAGRGRGRLRALRQIQAAGIAAEIAERAVADASQDIDPEALLTAALEKRLREGRLISSEREFARLYRYLMGLGFDSERVLALLRSRRDTSST